MSDNQKSQNAEAKQQSSSSAPQQPVMALSAPQPAPSAPAANPQSSTPQAFTGRVQLFNSSGAMLSVPVFNKSTGDSDMVFVQHGGRPKLLPGYIVDPVFASRNPSLQSTKISK